MSTKCTLAYAENFHFYREAFDSDHVYFELETTHFEATYGRVMIPIPIHVWETIRHLGGAELDLVDRSDEELLSRVQTEVEERLAEYQRISSDKPAGADLFALIGSHVYGTADEPREQQIRRGMEYFRREWKRQNELHARIISLQKALRER